MATQKQEEQHKNIEMMVAKSIDANTVSEKNIIENIESIKVHVNEVGAKLENMNSGHTAQTKSDSNDTHTKPTYAKVVSHSLIVKPKKREANSDKTKEMLKCVVNPDEAGVNGIKSLSNGAVLIQCKTNEAMAEIERKVKQHDPENYTLKENANASTNNIKIVGMTKKYEEQELSEIIKKKLEWCEGEVIKILKVYSDKNTRKERYNAIAEVSTPVMDEMIGLGRMNIEWDECKIHQYVQVKRCYKCLGFNHMAQTCKNKLACSKCAGEHNARECTAQTMKCVNCTTYNIRNKENVDTCHHAFARDCVALKQLMERIKNKKHDE